MQANHIAYEIDSFYFLTGKIFAEDLLKLCYIYAY